MDSPQQKFFVSDDGKEKLSITKAELQAGIDSGKHTDETLAWTKGMSEWLPLSDPSWEKHGIMIPTKLRASLRREHQKSKRDGVRMLFSLEPETRREHQKSKRDGVRTIWDKNGQKRWEANYKDDKRDGLETWWHEGQKMMESNWKDGKKDGLWTSWYENGQKRRENNYKDGKQEGLWTYWYENGQKKREATRTVKN